MSFIGTLFSYNGVRSEDMGISIVRMSTGFIESQFWGNRDLNYELVQGNDTPYYYSQKVEPFPVRLQLSPLENKWTSELKDAVSRWLNNGKFNEFYSVDDINRIYYLTYTGSPTLYKTGLNQGYLEVDFMNVDCYVRSPVYEKIFDLSAITDPTIVNVNDHGYANSGSVNKTYPELWIEKIGNGDLTIENLDDGGRVFQFEDLENGENVYIDNKNRHIESDIPDRSPTIYDAFNHQYVYFVYGVNRLKVTGACRLKFKYRQLFTSQ